jgi:hypothetical protein
MLLWPSPNTKIDIPTQETLRKLIRDLREWLQAA